MRVVAAVLLVMAACAGEPAEPVAGPGETAAGGTRLVVFTHCGFYEVELDGVVWTPESIERGASPEGTGFNATEGVASVDNGKLVFIADSGLTVTFVPAPEDLPPIPGCD